MWKFWLIVSGLCFVIESFTVGFFVFWFGIGAIIALISSLFIQNLFTQAIIFIISSSLLLILTKPLFKRFIKTPQTKPTNVYSVVGKEGIVIEDINAIEGSGKIKVNGELWSAVSEKNIARDTKVKIIGVNGVKLKVEKILNTDNVN